MVRWDLSGEDLGPHTGQCFSGADKFILHRFNYSTKRAPDDATIMWIQSFLCPGHLISEIDFWLKHEYLKWLLNVGLISLLEAVHWLPSTVLKGNSKLKMHALALHSHWFPIGNKSNFEN